MKIAIRKSRRLPSRCSLNSPRKYSSSTFSASSSTCRPSLKWKCTPNYSSNKLSISTTTLVQARSQPSIGWRAWSSTQAHLKEDTTTPWSSTRTGGTSLTTSQWLSSARQTSAGKPLEAMMSLTTGENIPPAPMPTSSFMSATRKLKNKQSMPNHRHAQHSSTRSSTKTWNLLHKSNIISLLSSSPFTTYFSSTPNPFWPKTNKLWAGSARSTSKC